MKAKEATRRQKEKMANHKIKSNDWAVLDEKGIRLYIVNKKTGEKKVLIG